MFLSLFKNVCTSLKSLLYTEEIGPTPDSGFDAHRYWGFRERPDRIVNRTDTDVLTRFSGYCRFAVYRDPVERLLSTYRNRALYPPSFRLHDLQYKGQKTTLDRFLDFVKTQYPLAFQPFHIVHRLEGLAFDPFLDVVEEILSIENPLLIDGHIRPQHQCYEEGDVDFIVPIQYLDAFLLERFGIRRVPVQNDTSGLPVTLTVDQIARIVKGN